MPVKDTKKTTKSATGETKTKTSRQLETNSVSQTSSPHGVSKTSKKSGWTFLTNHAHVIILLSKQPDLILREVAAQIGITERAVQRIIADLEEDGFLLREKVGRQNRYRVVHDLPLRHPIESHRRIGDLVALVLTPDES